MMVMVVTMVMITMMIAVVIAMVIKTPGNFGASGLMYHWFCRKRGFHVSSPYCDKFRQVSLSIVLRTLAFTHRFVGREKEQRRGVGDTTGEEVLDVGDFCWHMTAVNVDVKCEAKGEKMICKVGKQSK